MRHVAVLFLAGLLLLVACGGERPAAAPVPGAVRVSGSGLRVEAEALEAYLRRAEEVETRVPAGMYALYGYLLLRLDRESEAEGWFSKEKEIHPGFERADQRLAATARARGVVPALGPSPLAEQGWDVLRRYLEEHPAPTPAVLSEPALQAPSEVRMKIRAEAVTQAPQAERVAQRELPAPESVRNVPRQLVNVVAVATREGYAVALNLRGAVSEYRTFQLDDPLRYVIDLPGDWRNPGPGSYRPGYEGRKVVRRIRVGEHPDKLRVVLDLARRPGSPPRVVPNEVGLTVLIP